MTLRNAPVPALFIAFFLIACGDDDRPPPAPTPDASYPDAGPRDAGPRPRDAGMDAGSFDAGPPMDSGPTDAAPSDSGPPDTGPPDAGPPPAPREQLATGDEHTCVIRPDRRVACWGDNDFGELGNGTRTAENRPVSTAMLEGAFGIAAGANHTCAMVGAGSVRCWGRNDDGQLGDTTTLQRSFPTDVVLLPDAVDVCAGEAHTCVVVSDGTVKCWGLDANGQLGDGRADFGSRAPSTPAVGVSGALEVVCGNAHTCALISDGRVMCWGSNEFAQIGRAALLALNATPEAVPMIGDAIAVGAGAEHTCVVRAGGQVWCFGKNDYGQTGQLPPMAPPLITPAPMRVGITFAGAFQSELGRSHSCAAHGAGDYLCWGRNDSGQLGDGTTVNRSTVDGVMGLVPETAEVAAGRSHSCAMTTAGRVFCWGSNSGGQLGVGPMPPDPTIPREVTFPAGL